MTDHRVGPGGPPCILFSGSVCTMEFLAAVALAFVPLFVAIDVPGVMPIFVGMTTEIEDRRRRRIILSKVR